MACAVEALLGGFGLDVSRDALGSVQAVGRSGPPRVLVTAHLDQVGYMVSHVAGDHARCVPVGSPSPPSGARVPVHVCGLRGVIDAELTVDDDEAAGILRAASLTGVGVGDHVVFAGGFKRGPGEVVIGPALDDRIGCLVAVHAARALAGRGAVAFAWTVQEETTQGGVVRVARALRPDAVVVVDVTPTVDDVDEGSLIRLGGGPAVTLLDGGMVAASALVGGVREAAAAAGTAWQPEVTGEGLSEAGHVQGTLGIPSLALLVPVDGMHGPLERADLGDVRAAGGLLVALVGQLLEPGEESAHTR